jgi:hypothetical protein
MQRVRVPVTDSANLAVLNANEMYVHEHADHGDEHDDDWMHVVLANRGKLGK